MSQYIHKTEKKNIVYGWDRPMDYIFVMIYDKDHNMLYSNIDDSKIDFTCQVDFTYFDEVLKQFDVELPDKEKIKVIEERLVYLDTIEDIPFRIKANYNSDLIGETGSKNQFGIEIGQALNGCECFDNIMDYEFFESKLLAITRVNQINGAFIDDWGDI